jgi:ribosomal protein S18 acetylase RimI-like enzyme
LVPTITVSKHTWGSAIDDEIERLIYEVFVTEGYTNSDDARKAFTPEKLKNRGTVFLARESTTGYLVGVVFYVPGATNVSQIADEREAEIHLLAVRLSYRGLGLGKKLIAACLDQAKSDGVIRLVLSTQASMKNAHRLYAKLGFIRNETRDWLRPAGGTYLVYEKVLRGNLEVKPK